MFLRPTIQRPTRLLAMAVLLGTAAWLPSPLLAAEAGQPMAGMTVAQNDVMAQDLTAQNDVMAPDDDSDGPADRAQGHDRWAHDGSGEQDHSQARFGDSDGQDRGNQDRGGRDRGWRDHGGWNQAGDDRSGNWDRRGRDAGDDDHGGWSPERRRMAAMHARMMQMMGAGRQPAAAFRIEIGDTKMAVRCSPRETMRECADAALSVANRLREASAAARSTGSPAAPSGPGSSGGSGTPTPGNSGSGNPGSSSSGGAGGSTAQ